jgi:Zn-dependent oligopeptidase
MKIHAANPLQQTLTQTYKQTKQEWSSFEPINSNTSFTQLRHLATYAASYYTYLHCRVLSSTAWKKYFEIQPLNRNEGRKFVTKVLNRGGLLELNELHLYLFGNETHQNNNHLELDTSYFVKTFEQK